MVVRERKYDDDNVESRKANMANIAMGVY